MARKLYTAVPIRGFSLLTEVRLYDETIEHIAEQHAEFRLQLPSYRSGLVVAARHPTRFHASTTNPGRSVVLVSESFSCFGEPVHMPIKLVEAASGRVQTAYFASGVYAGRLLWSVNDE